VIIKSYEIIKNNKKFSNYNLFLLYGENEGLKNDIFDSIKKLSNKTAEFLSMYETEVLANEENLYNSIYSGSLFSSSKIITIKGSSDKLLKNLTNILEKLPQNITLIIFSGILEKKSKLRAMFEKRGNAICVPCYLDNERDLHTIALSEFKKNEISVSRESLNLLVEKSNNDRNNLKNEIEKIILFSFYNKKIEIDELRNIINFSGEYKSDIFINECLCGNISQFKKMLSEFYAGAINQIFLLRILSNKVQRLINLKEQTSEKSNLESVINNAKPPIFWQEKNIVKKQLTLWKSIELKEIIGEINQTELLCKKKPQISKIIFFNFFSELCSRANNYSL